MGNRLKLNHIGVIIQARMGSSRLPGKSMMKVGDCLLIDHVVLRSIAAVERRNVYLATTNLVEDDCLASHVSSQYKVNVFRGDSQDVRSRFLEIAVAAGIATVVRITADDPFKDPSHIIDAIQSLKDSGADYFNNFERKLFPIGLDVEAFTLNALRRNIEFDDSSESKEHVTLGIRRDPTFSKIYKTGVPELTDVRLTIDTFDDLEYCNNLIQYAPEMNRISFDWPTTRSAVIELENRGRRIH